MMSILKVARGNIITPLLQRRDAKRYLIPNPRYLSAALYYIEKKLHKLLMIAYMLMEKYLNMFLNDLESFKSR